MNQWSILKNSLAVVPAYSMLNNFCYWSWLMDNRKKIIKL